MERHRRLNFIWVLTLCVAVRWTSAAEEPSCPEIHAIAGMAGARTTAALMAWKSRAGDSYRADVVFAFRFFELHSRDLSAAKSVLNLIPKDEDQDSAWHETGALLCKTESYDDMKVLGKFGNRPPHDLAIAVLLIPDKMADYVSYANMSVADPDSDYAVQMQAVCRSKHKEFLKAVNQLPADAKKWFLSSTFNPDGCKILKYPEAD